MNRNTTWSLHAHRGNGCFHLASIVRNANGRKLWDGCSATVERLDDTTTRVWFQPAEGKSHPHAIAEAHEFAASVFACVAEHDDELAAGNVDLGIAASAVVVQGLDKGGPTVFVDVKHERGLAAVVVGCYFCDDLTNELA